MAVRTFQTAFTGGELSPQLHARTDFPKLAQGAERLKNMIVRPHGGASRRPGAYYIADTFDQTARSWLYPFIFSNEQAYVLEFAPFTLRAFRDRQLVIAGGDGTELVTNGAFATDLTGWTEVNTGTGDTTWSGGQALLTGGATGTAILSQSIATVAGERYSVNFDVTIAGITWWVGTASGLTDLVPETHAVQGRAGAVFQATTTAAVIQFFTGEAEVSHLDNVSLQLAEPLELTTPWDADEIPELRMAQAADVMYITHQQHQPHKLLRITPTVFELRPVTLAPPPTRELPETFPAHLTLAAVSGTNVQADATGGVFLAGDLHKILRAGAGRASIVTVDSATQVHLNVIDAFSTVGPHYAGEWSLRGSPAFDLDPNIKGPVGAIVTLTATGASFRATDVGRYVRIYDGLVRITGVTSATVATGEIVVELDVELADPPAALAGAWFLETPIWSDDRGWPGACCFHDQRLVLGGSPSDPLGVAGSVTSDYENFALGPNDDAAWDYELVGAYNVIRALVSQRSLIALTPGAEHVISGGDNSTPHITPASVFAQTDTAYGCASDPAPLHVGNAVIFVQRGGTRIRELTYDFGTDARVAPDLGMLAEHLLRPGIEQLARQTSPDSIVYALRSDGALLVCAYERPEQVVAWSRWITGAAQDLTDGFYESVCVIPNACDTGDEVWTTVRRRYDVSAPAATLTPSALTGTITFTASAPVFTAAHAGYVLTSLNTNGIATIDTVTDSTHVTGTSLEDFESLDAIVAAAWELALTHRMVELFDYGVTTDSAVASTGTVISSLTGLDHLEGDTVTVVADGVDSTAVVTDGAITLALAATDVEAGINFVSRIRTLRPDFSTQGGPSLARVRRVVDAVVRFYCCGPGWRINQLETDLTGTETRRDDLNVDTGFTEYVQDRLVANLGWDRLGRVTVDQPRPFKGTVLAIGGRIEVEDEG